MSLTYSWFSCFIILVISHYGSLDTPETGPELSSDESSDNEPKSVSVEQLHQPATFHWTQGIVRYYVDPESYDGVISNRISMAMSTIQSVSCIVFREMSDKPPEGYVGHTWLLLTNPKNVRECVHDTYIGNGGKAIMTLGYDCMQRRDIIHALMHVLGFRDEVTNPQRDLYVRILWQNIQPKYHSLFRIRTDETPHKMNVEYDPMSIMHFHDRAFSANGAATIIPLMPGLLINPSDKLSQLDIMKLRLAFGHECNKRKVGNLFETCQNALQDSDSEDDQSLNGEQGEASANDDHGNAGQDSDKVMTPLGEDHQEQNRQVVYKG